MTYEQLIYDHFDFVQCSLECGTGWYEIIYKMCVEIDDLYFKRDCNIDVTILQIKEKYGALRVSDNKLDAEIGFIVSKYEELSKHTCEICGAEGKLINDGYWIKVRCEDCL